MSDSRPRYPTTPMCDGALLEAFESTVRDSDVFVSTAAKCGQTWLTTLLHHLKTRGRQPDLGGKGLFAVVPWLEFPLDPSSGEAFEREARLAWLESLDEPRIFKMHVIWPEIPRPPGSRARVLTVTRDPRDVPYSMYMHLRGMNLADPVGDFDTYFERWMELGLYFKFVRSFWPHHADPDVLWLRYEDLKQDLEREARRAIAFLGWDVTDDDLARVLPLVDVQHMRRTERTHLGMTTSGMWKPDAVFVREGAVGCNRSRLSPEQERRIIERARAELEPACFDWVVSQGA